MVGIAHGINRNRGFTLVELLVALALSSIIFTSAYQTIGNLVQYQTRAALKDRVQTDRQLLRRLFTRLVEEGLHVDDLRHRFGRERIFRGEKDSIQLLSRAYSRNFKNSGYRVFRLFLRGHRLMVSYRPYGHRSRQTGVSETDTGLRLNALQLSYYDGEHWRSEWSGRRHLPRFIRLVADLESGIRIELVRETSVG